MNTGSKKIVCNADWARFAMAKPAAEIDFNPDRKGILKRLNSATIGGNREGLGNAQRVVLHPGTGNSAIGHADSSYHLDLEHALKHPNPVYGLIRKRDGVPALHVRSDSDLPGAKPFADKWKMPLHTEQWEANA